MTMQILKLCLALPSEELPAQLPSTKFTWERAIVEVHGEIF